MRISVVIPTYNGAAWIAQAIDSALAQSYPPHEVIVVDDGSVDGTLEIVRSRPCVRLIPQSNQGTATARNRGIREATGDWIALLDHDDYFLPDKLLRQKELAETNEQAVAIYSDFELLYPDGTKTPTCGLRPTDLWPAVRYRSPIQPSTLLVRKAALEELGGFDTSIRMVSDWDLSFRLTERFTTRRILHVPEPLMVYRVGHGNMSANHAELLANSLLLVDHRLLTGTRGIRRALWRRRIRSRLLYETAIMLRQKGDPGHLDLALQSLASWPCCGRVVQPRRYKVLAHMLWARLISGTCNEMYFSR